MMNPMKLYDYFISDHIVDLIIENFCSNGYIIIQLLKNIAYLLFSFRANSLLSFFIKLYLSLKQLIFSKFNCISKALVHCLVLF